MSTELRLAIWPAATEGQHRMPGVRALTPARATSRFALPLHGRFSRKPLVLVVLAHSAAFAMLISATPAEPRIEASMTPMLVSLVDNPQPAPETATPEPALPEPRPVIKKQKSPPQEIKPREIKPQKIKPKEIKPTPQPDVAESTPTPPMASEPAIATEEADVPATPSPQPVVAAAADKPSPKEEAVAEPKVEPPRFGAAYLHNPPPDYPALSRRMGEQGRVVLRVLVTADGAAESVQVETGSGYSRLDQAAMASVKKWRFIPARRNNQPVSAYVLVPVKFSLEG